MQTFGFSRGKWSKLRKLLDDLTIDDTQTDLHEGYSDTCIMGLSKVERREEGVFLSGQEYNPCSMFVSSDIIESKRRLCHPRLIQHRPSHRKPEILA